MNAREFSDPRLAAFLEEQASWLEDYARQCGSVGASLPEARRRRDWESRADALLRRAGVCRQTLESLRGHGPDDLS